MGEDEKKKGASSDHQQYPHPPEYGTFQGVANYPPPPPPHQQPPPPPPPPTGFPQPVPPPGAADPPAPHPQYYTQGYQTVQGYAVAEGIPVRERRLPCCGIGCGWFLLFLLQLLSSSVQQREVMPGNLRGRNCIACKIDTHESRFLKGYIWMSICI